jgi:nucleotide-binding universal stress UspA family protein
MQMTKYMVAVDGSEHSNKAYAIAAKLLTAKDEVIFVTVGQKGKGAAAQDLLDTWTKKAEADGVRPLLSPLSITSSSFLFDFGRPPPFLHQRLQFHAKPLFLESTDPRDAICNSVTEHGIDILVVGTRGLGTIKRYHPPDLSST